MGKTQFGLKCQLEPYNTKAKIEKNYELIH